MRIDRFTGAVAAAAVLAAPWPAMAQQPTAKAPTEKPRQLVLETKPWKGDFDGMLERRQIRFLVPYSRTLFFNDKGHERGSRPSSRAISSAGSTRSTPSSSASGR